MRVVHILLIGAQWLSGRVLDLRPKSRGFEPHRRHCIVVLEQDTFILAWYWLNPGRPVPVLMGLTESNQTKHVVNCSAHFSLVKINQILSIKM